jgi:hypothetical protein
MKPVRSFRPRLQECVLDERVMPVVANLGTIVLTTSGYLLMTPFPGAMSVGYGAAPGVSGAPIPTSFSMTGSGGISSVGPSNLTGISAFAATSAATGAATAVPGSTTGAAGLSISVGSGANTPGGPVIPLVTRDTQAFDTPSQRPVNGRASGGDRTPVLPPGQVYSGGVAVPAPGAAAPAETQGEPTTAVPRVRPFELAQTLPRDAGFPVQAGVCSLAARAAVG